MREGYTYHVNQSGKSISEIHAIIVRLCELRYPPITYREVTSTLPLPPPEIYTDRISMAVSFYRKQSWYVNGWGKMKTLPVVYGRLVVLACSWLGCRTLTVDGKGHGNKNGKRIE